MDWNLFRILADLSHTLSKCILIWAIHSNKSAEGVSLITQIFYLVVFLCRYLPFPLLTDAYIDTNTFHVVWNFTLKIFYIVSSAYIIFIMMRVFARTREREKAWKIGIASFVGSLIAAPIVMLLLMKKVMWGFRNFSWTFSLILESVCVLPQLLLLRQTTVPTVIDSFYLVTLGSYRGFYVLNWIVRGIKHEPNSPVQIIFGVLQTALYIDFAWVYLTRQRVKLRGGTVVDSEDLSQGWLVKRFIGRFRGETDEEAQDGRQRGGYDGTAEEGQTPRSGGRNWGARGISVSADDTVHEGEADALADPRRFEDESDDEDAKKGANGTTSAGTVGNGSEWRDESGR